MKDELNSQLLTLANHQILQDTFTSDIGLFSGKMGSLMFFLIYAAYTKNSLYEKYAEKLLEEIYKDIVTDLTFHFSNGLCGIGWGIEYLIQHHYMEGDTDTALLDIDYLVMQYYPIYIEDHSLERGLEGLVYYVMSRLCAQRDDCTYIPFDLQYLERLHLACLSVPIKNRTEVLSLYIDNKRVFPYKSCLLKILDILERKQDIKSINWRTGLRMLIE